MILVGLWISKERPTMTTFLKPIMCSLWTIFSVKVCTNVLKHSISLYTHHFASFSGHVGCIHHGLSHAVLVLCSLDLPAQSIVLNLKQLNGRFACNFCEHEGVSNLLPIYIVIGNINLTSHQEPTSIENARNCSFTFQCKSTNLSISMCLMSVNVFILFSRMGKGSKGNICFGTTSSFWAC